jgi:hypothetical protein
MPGVNEDLAATAVWGTQQLAVMGDATVDGVFGLWYGKGPGVDRAGDPLKHGNYTGTHPNGGVLVVTGDDHQGKSSTIAHHSQQALAANSIPVLYPADVSEFVPYALLGWALSRYSGCWVGFKVVNETVEQAMTCDLDLDALAIETPEPRELPPEGIHYRGTFTPAQDEVILRRWKLPLVQRFARANRIDRQTLGDAHAKLGIVTAGKTWHEVRLALRCAGRRRRPAPARWAWRSTRSACCGRWSPKAWPNSPPASRSCSSWRTRRPSSRPGRGHPLQPAAAPAHHRQGRRGRPAAAQRRRRLRSHRPGAGHRRPAAGAGPGDDELRSACRRCRPAGARCWR